MKQLIQISMSLLLGILMFSCKTPDITLQKSINVKDSIWETKQIIHRDTTIIIPADTLQIRSLFNDLKDSIVKRSNRATLVMKRVGDSVDCECHTDELKQIIALQDMIIQRNRQIETLEQEAILRTEYRIPSWAKPLLWIGVAAIAFLGFKLLKPKLLKL